MTKSNGQTRDARGRFASKPDFAWNSRELAQLMTGQQTVLNAMLQRSGLLRQLLDQRRDIDDECGYPKTEAIDITKYKLLYEREPVAARVVKLYPQECWRRPPDVYETEDSDEETAFEAAWDQLGRSLQGDSWLQDQEGNPIWEHLRRADEVSGIGSYGILLLGLSDGLELDQPVERRKGLKLLYLRAYDEEQAQIINYENDPQNPRYGMPTVYSVQLFDATAGVGSSGTMGLDTKRVHVHWSRTLHLADNLQTSEVFGVPRMRDVYNRLYDLRKIYSGSAEMYWRGAFPGLAIETNPQLGGDVAIDESALRDAMENYMNGLQRYLFLGGMQAKSLPPQIADPANWIDIQLTAICVRLGVPKRVFMGSERGELASSQDAQYWAERVRDRQLSYLSPRVVAPFVNRLIQLQVLPEPEGFSISWPELYQAGPQERAQVALTRTEALVKYVQGNAEALLTPMDFLTRLMEFNQDEAMEIIEAAAEELEGEPEEQFDVQPQQPEPAASGEDIGIAAPAGQPAGGRPLPVGRDLPAE